MRYYEDVAQNIRVFFTYFPNAVMPLTLSDFSNNKWGVDFQGRKKAGIATANQTILPHAGKYRMGQSFYRTMLSI